MKSQKIFCLMHELHLETLRLSPKCTISSSSDCRLPLSCLLYKKQKSKYTKRKNKFDPLTLSSVARHINASSIFEFSLALASSTNNTSGMYWHIASASSNSTSLKFSKSALLPTKANRTELPE